MVTKYIFTKSICHMYLQKVYIFTYIFSKLYILNIYYIIEYIHYKLN